MMIINKTQWKSIIRTEWFNDVAENNGNSKVNSF